MSTRHFGVGSITLAVLTVVLTSLAGSTQAGRVAFCWTTEHRLPPEVRLRSVDGSQSDVHQAIAEWIETRDGQVIDSSDRFPYAFQLEPGASADFNAAEALAQPLWSKYQRGRAGKLKRKKSNSLRKLTESQIDRIPSALPGYRLLARLSDRTRTYQQKVQVGTITMPGVPTPSFITKSGRVVKLAPVPIVIPQYETKTKEISFHSQLEFFVFSIDEATYVYAVGTPVSGSMLADYGNTIGSNWWTEVSSGQEASLVTEAYEFISRAVGAARDE